MKFPLEIYSSKKEYFEQKGIGNSPKNKSLEVKKINQNLVQQFYEKHPDVVAHGKTLRNHKGT